MIEEALAIVTDPDYKFDLSVQLGRLEVAKVHFSYSLSFLWFVSHISNLFLLYSSCQMSDLTMQEIAEEAQSESKWKQLGELAMSSGKVYVVKCFTVLDLSLNREGGSIS